MSESIGRSAVVVRPRYNEDVDLSSSVINAIVTGGHRDPFSVLGPHADRDAAATVRGFLPDAKEVAVVSRETYDSPQPLRRAHAAGLWEGTLPWPGTRAYRLRLTDHEGHVSEIEDPYRFPPTLSDYDLHLLAEGTHYRI